MTSLTHATVGDPQLSAAVTEAILTGGTNDAHCTETFAGQLIVGGWRSSTVTVNEQVEEFPAPSAARYTTVLIPNGNVLPEGRPLIKVMLGAVQLSLALIEPYETTAVHNPGAVLAVTLAGQLITGAWLSTTVTVKEQVAVFPAASVAL